MNSTVDKSNATEKPRLHVAYPMIFVVDVTKATEYYKSKLGFKVDFLYGEPPFYGMMTRDGASLHFRHIDKYPLIRSEEDLLATAISVSEVKSLFLEFKDSGAEFHQTLKRQPWGASDFIVKDPDGNLLNFASVTK
jgi:uncharacterized glyoxalase superfamily protein PhnB